MKKTAFSVLLLAFASSAFASELVTLTAGDIKAAGGAVPEVSVPARAEKSESSGRELQLDVRRNSTGREARAEAPAAGMELRVRETSTGSFEASLNIDSQPLRAKIYRSPGAGSYLSYYLSGPGMSLHVDGTADQYNLYGNITVDGKSRYVNVSVSGYSGLSCHAGGSGLSLDVERGGIAGTYIPVQHSKKAVAAVVSLILAIQVDSGRQSY